MNRVGAAAILLTVLLNGTLSCNISFAQSTACALQAPKPVNLAVVKPIFWEHFCAGMSGNRCDHRWANISPLMSRLAIDPDVETIGSEAYMLATVDLEVGGRYDFNESTVEAVNANKKPRYYPWIGRGWVQFTYRDKYARVTIHLKQLDEFKGQDVDILKNQELAGRPDIAYTILVKGMKLGWFEVYRRNAQGGCGKAKNCGPGIALSDFINTSKTDYDHARAVINANCMHKPCTDQKYGERGFIPEASMLDRAGEGSASAKKFETLLCKGMGVLQ